MNKPPSGWIEVRQLAKLVLRDDGMALAIGIQQTPLVAGYTVFALEVPKSAAEAGAEGVFANHSHEIVADNVTSIVKAKRIATQYVTKWKRSEKPKERCDCGPIELSCPVPSVP